MVAVAAACSLKPRKVLGRGLATVADRRVVGCEDAAWVLRAAVGPVALGLLARTGIVEAKPVLKPGDGFLVLGLYRVDQLADARADDPDRFLGGSGTEHRHRVDDLRGRLCEQTDLLGELKRALEDEALLAVQEQASAEAHQARRVKARVVYGQVERELPAQAEARP